MAVPIPQRTVKIVCQDCGWHVILTLGGHGDCLTPLDVAVRMPPTVCPECGANDLEEVPPTLAERLSPAERRRTQEYIRSRRPPDIDLTAPHGHD